MEQDAYEMFTRAHRVYIKGIRNAIFERLFAAYGDDWWERGVLSAIGENQRENMERDRQKGEPEDRTQLIDTAHFARIIERNHAAAFANEFANIDYTLRLFSLLSAKRNEWAHVLDDQWTPTDIMRSIQAMREILISLRRREALELNQMFQESLDQQGSIPEEVLNLPQEPSPAPDNDGGPLPADYALLGFWRALESYLVVESTVQPGGDEERERGVVNLELRVTNAAPVGEGRPEIIFRNVQLSVTGAENRRRYGEEYFDLGELGQGESITSEFTCAARGLASVEFRVVGEVDQDRFFQVQRRNTLPAEFVTPLLERLSSQLEQVGIEETLAKVVETAARIRPDLTFAEVSAIRNELTQLKPRIAEKREALGALFGEYHLSRESPLGAPLREVILLLHNLETEKITAMDNAIAQTDLASIRSVAHDFEQLQISVLRARETIKQRMGANRL